MMKNLLNRGYAFGATVAGLVATLALTARASTDPDIQQAGAALATSTKDNLVGLVSANIGYVAIVFALVLGIYFVMRLFKRAAR